jgi:hypothetical protein
MIIVLGFLLVGELGCKGSRMNVLWHFVLQDGSTARCRHNDMADDFRGKTVSDQRLGDWRRP